MSEDAAIIAFIIIITIAFIKYTFTFFFTFIKTSPFIIIETVIIIQGYFTAFLIFIWPFIIIQEVKITIIATPITSYSVRNSRMLRVAQ